MQWQFGLGEFQKSIFDNLNDECSVKLPVDISDTLFSHLL